VDVQAKRTDSITCHNQSINQSINQINQSYFLTWLGNKLQRPQKGGTVKR